MRPIVHVVDCPFPSDRARAFPPSTPLFSRQKASNTATSPRLVIEVRTSRGLVLLVGVDPIAHTPALRSARTHRGPSIPLAWKRISALRRSARARLPFLWRGRETLPGSCLHRRRGRRISAYRDTSPIATSNLWISGHVHPTDEADVRGLDSSGRRPPPRETTFVLAKCEAGHIRGNHRRRSHAGRNRRMRNERVGVARATRPRRGKK